MLPLQLRAWVSAPNYAQCNGDLIYINPYIIHRLRDNPFKSIKREFPIDYSYGKSQTILTNIILPEGFEVKENLADRMLIVGPNLVRYTRQVQINGNIIQVKSKYDICKSEIEPEYYVQLKDLYAQMVAIQSEQFVFSRIKSTTKSPAPVVKPPQKDKKTVQKKGKK